MQKFNACQRLIFFFCLFLSICFNKLQAQAVGYTPANVFVGENGEGRIIIPINIPKGTFLQPTLSLNYSSQIGNGLQGFGFNIDGLQAITRVPSTVAQDGTSRGIDFTTADKFAWNGERLVGVSGTYGMDNSEYRTEQNTFARVRSFGNTGFGPEKFLIQQKDGLNLEFGYTSDARIEAAGTTNKPILWLLNKVYDANGNYYTISYAEDNANGEARPIEIRYTGNTRTGLIPYNRIVFNYENRSDNITKYFNSYKSVTTKRLKEVITYEKTSQFRRYLLAYGATVVSGFSKLVKVTEYGSDNVSYLKPIDITWMAPVAPANFNFNKIGTGYWSAHGGGTSNNVTGDFNGDGKADMAAYNSTYNGGSWHVCLSTGTGFTQAFWGGHKEGIGNNATGDFNGDGRTDLIAYSGSGNGNGLWTVSLSTGSSFTNQTWPAHNGGMGNNLIGDFNGDGRSDLAAYNSTYNGGSWHVCLSTGTGFIQTFWVGHKYGVPSSIVADFNGDGKSDIAGFTGGQSGWEVSLSTGNSFTNSLWYGPWAAKNNAFVGDFNGDGLADFASYADASSGTWAINLSTGSRFIQNGWIGHRGSEKNNVIGDFNGDGLTDMAGYAGNGSWHVSLSTGKSFNSDNFWQGHGGSEKNNVAGDFDGDGSTDLTGYTGSNGSWHVTLSNAVKEFASTVRNGNGVLSAFEYAPLTIPSVFTKGTGAVYPSVDFIGSLYVVNALTSSNGIGGSRRITYTYESSKYDLSGRSFQGFDKITQNDLATGMSQTTFYNRNPDYIGAKLKRIEMRYSGQLIKSMTYSASLTSAFSSKIKFAYYTSIGETYYEPGQTNPYRSKLSEYGYDAYGNVNYINESYSGNSYRIETVRTYSNNESTWILGRIATSKVTKVTSGKPSIVKNITFSYDGNGNLTREVFLPNEGTRRIQTDYVLDAYGNKVSITKLGADFASRTETFVFDSEGRFVIRSINPLEHTNQFTYTKGLLTAEVDADNLTLRITRDAFGREVRRDFPDGTWQTTAYFNCGSGNGSCPLGTIYYIEERASGSGISRTYFDMLDRIIRDEDETFNGTRAYVDHQYNADGTEKAVSKSYYQGNTPFWVTYEYDALKRVVKEIQPGNRVSTYSYNGLTQTAQNPEGQRRTIVENSMGKTITSTDHQGNTLTFDYDSDHNLLSTTDARNNKLIVNTYDISGFKTSVIDPDMGRYTYTYNALGLITAQTNASNEVTRTEYDLLDRPVKRTEPEGTTEWRYDPMNAKGEVSQILFNGAVVLTYQYNNLGKLVAIIEGRNAGTKRFDYAYNANGQVETLTYPNNLKLRYTYTNRGFLSEVKNANSSQLYWQANGYDEDNSLTGFTLGNGLRTNRTFNAQTGFLTNIQTGSTLSPTSVQNMRFIYSATGNVTTRFDDKFNLAEYFEYDNLSRLTSAKVVKTGTGAFSGTPITVAYDMWGNIIYKSDVGTYRYGEGGRGLHTLTSIDHSGVPNCIYPLNQDVSITSYNYVRRIANQNAEVLITYGVNRDRQSVVTKKNGLVVSDKSIYQGIYEEIKDATGVLTTVCYIKAGTELCAFVSKTGTQAEKTTYVHTDHLGSIYAHTSQTGTVDRRFSYDAWGKSRMPETWQPLFVLPGIPAFQRGFTSHEMLDIDGLICMNARVYNPILGRFLTPDPYIQFPEDLQSYNRYSYVLNNPLSMTDPTGHFSLKSIGKFLKENVGLVFTAAVLVVTGGTGAIFGTILGSTFLGSVASAATIGFGATFTQAFVNGAGFNNALNLGIQGALWAGASAGLSYGLNSLLPDKPILKNPFYNETKLTMNGVVQGGINKIRGGDFRKGFLTSFITSQVKLARDAFVEWRANKEGILSENQIKRGSYKLAKDYEHYENQASQKGPYIVKNGQRIFKSETVSVLDMDAYNVGKFEDGFWGESGWLKNLAKWVPGMNSMAVSHDYFAGWASNNGLGWFDEWVINAGTIPVFTTIEYIGLRGTLSYSKNN